MKVFPMTRHFVACVLIATCLVLLSACSKPSDPVEGQTPSEAPSKDAAMNQHADDTNDGSSAGHDGEADGARAVKMDAAAMEAAGIRVQKLQPAMQSERLRAPGEVVDNAYGTTLITPRVESLVVNRLAKLGDEVIAGTPLVTLASVQVSDAQADLKIAEQEWRRVSALGREAIAGRRINEAKIAVDRARAKAQAYGLPGTSSGGVNGQFTLSAPHAGRITEDAFVVGERIEPGRTLYRLVDESIVWVDAKLPSPTALRVNQGDAATVVVGKERIAGKVLRSAHRTSETTRNAVIRVEVPNEDDRLHSGDYVDVFFDTGAGTGEAEQLALPTEALVQIEGDTIAFRKNEEGALEAVAVRTGNVFGDTTVVTEGLQAGDMVVVEGAFTLKAQLLKEQLGEGHGH